MRVEVDFGLCEANAVCMGLAPEIFDLGDDDVLQVLAGVIPVESQARVEEATRQCPRQAITVQP